MPLRGLRKLGPHLKSSPPGRERRVNGRSGQASPLQISAAGISLAILERSVAKENLWLGIRSVILSFQCFRRAWLLNLGSIQKAFQLADAGRMPHFTQRFGFDLSYPFASDAKLPTDFFKSATIAVD